MTFEPSMQTRARVSALRSVIQAEPIRACVVGAGRSGRGAIRLLEDLRARVDVLDDAAGVGGIARPFHKAHVDAADLVVISPGVPRTRPELADAIEAGKVVGEVELASWFVDAPMVGITGTNGKSTTTSLVAHGLRSAGRAVFEGGNLGTPLSELALSMRGGTPVDVAVVELSSFQLESLVEATFRVGVWLNLTPDHVDRYRSFEEYGHAKRRLIEQRTIDGWGVINAKDSTCMRMALEWGGPLRWFSGRGSSDLAGPLGTVVDEAARAIRRFDGVEEQYRVEGPGLVGAHNRENGAAAIEALRLMGCSPEQVQVALSTFPGLPHRLERIATRDGLRWVNDSKATNVDAAVTGVQAADPPVVLLCGGRGKRGSYQPLVEAARQAGVVLVLAFGEDAENLARAFASSVPVEIHPDLASAVVVARRRAPAGATVLLSPACASFDQFDDFEHRGNVFRSLVEGLQR
jgi:UDP-N-acetylmuramoylalanine--D-glutamate ligase